MTRVITVTSGKGGVGKTNISANLAIHLAHLGYRTCLFDADLGLANINILLKIYPEHNLKDVILKGMDIQDILIEPLPGMDIIPGSSGVEEMANLDPDQIVNLITEFSKLDTYDYFIIDTAAGVSRDVIAFSLAASELVLIITPDPTSLTDAYSLLKILTLNGFNDQVMVIINQSPGLQSAKNALGKMMTTCTRYLNLKLIPIGVLGRDQNVISAVSRQKPFITLYPNTSASKSIKKIAENLIKKENQGELTLELNSFWERCLSFFTKKIRISPKQTEDETLPGSEETSGMPLPDPPLAANDETPSQSILSSPEASPPHNDHAISQSPSLGESPALSSSPPEPAENHTKSPSLPIESLPSSPQATTETAPGIPETTQMIQQTNQLLNQVVESIASVATELKELRELFAKSQTGGDLVDKEQQSGKNQTKNSGKREKDDIQLTRLLSDYAMFQSLEDQEIKAIVRSLKLREAGSGEIIIQKGDPGENLYIIISGVVDVLDDQQRVLDSMGSEDVFGEMSLISGDPVNATIQVVEKAQLLYLNGKEFIRLLRTYPGLQMYFARLLSKRLSNRLKKADTVTNEYLQSGLSGSLTETSVAELLQMLNMGQKTGVVTFHFLSGSATASFLDGELVAARFDETQDIEAFFKILKETKGRFTYAPELPENEASRPPLGHFMRLLMEGISRIDEANE